MDYEVNQRRIFENAMQPFSPTNIFNEIMENTGDFGEGNGNLTSIFVFDTNALHYNFEPFQHRLMVHLESIIDQVINFNPDFKMMKLQLPKLDIKSFSGFSAEFWQKPLIRIIRKEFEEMVIAIKNAYSQNHNKRELGIQEDPWENYLYHDSKFMLPLINHKQTLPISKQILLFKFLHVNSLGDQDVSVHFNI